MQQNQEYKNFSKYKLSYGLSPNTMINLFNIYIHPIFEYGSPVTIMSKHLKTRDSTQATYFKKILNLPSFTFHKIALKLANQVSTTERIHFLAQKWLTKAQKYNQSMNF